MWLYFCIIAWVTVPISLSLRAWYVGDKREKAYWAKRDEERVQEVIPLRIK